MTPRALLPPALFGLAALALWQAGVAALHVPAVILPGPVAMRAKSSVTGAKQSSRSLCRA